MDEPLLRIENLRVHYGGDREGFWGRQRNKVHAVDDISFEIRRGETFGLVGESGSGKTTTGRAILRRVPITGGEIRYNGQLITTVEGRDLRSLRRNMQAVSQNPYGSLNPRWKVLDIVAEPLVVHKIVRSAKHARDRVVELLELTGLSADDLYKYPHAFSGGQRQRIAIARAIALEPEFIVADEPVSALDVSIQAQVVNLLQDLQERLNLTYLFIAHDLAVVRHISHRIGIMYAGKLVEIAEGDAVYESPIHPYTEALLSAVPNPNPAMERQRVRMVLSGELPSPTNPPPGCRFQTRCPIAQDKCRIAEPPLETKVDEHLAACWFR